MRNELVRQLIAQDDKDTYFLTADVGFGCLEPLEEKMQDRFINVGLAEQSMIGIAAGLALSGKKVYTYTMCAFYLRAIEQIRNDICYQDLPVTMIGVGTGYDYAQLGNTHFANEDGNIISCLKNIQVTTPANVKEMREIMKARIKPNSPLYLRISKFDESKETVLVNTVDSSKYYKFGGSPEYFKLLDSKNGNKE